MFWKKEVDSKLQLEVCILNELQRIAVLLRILNENLIGEKK